MRKIIHIDMDAFYASVEQRDNPSLRGKPVVVGGKPGGRGVVAAASYEARKFGIHSAMPSAQAGRLCPDAIFVRGRMDVYVAVSKQIREIFGRYTDAIEPLSLDEAYLDVTTNKLDIPYASTIAKEIRKAIWDELQLTASAGIAPAKFLAKVASDVNKPNGQFVITPDQVDAFVRELPVGKISGIGKVTQERLAKKGILKAGDLRQFSKIELQQQFGKSGLRYYDLSRGIDHRSVRTSRKRKSVGAERTYSEDSSDIPWILQQLSTICQRVHDRNKGVARTLTLKVRYSDFTTITRSKTSEIPYSSPELMLATCEELLRQKTQAGERSVRLLGVSLSGFEGESAQLELNV